MSRNLRLTDEQLATLKKKLRKPIEPSPELTKALTILAKQSAKPSKYRNVREGKYASRKEAARSEELKLLEKAGKIRNLREQVKYELIPAQYRDGKCVERACSYVADWTYEQEIEDESGSGWRFQVEDAKGMRTPLYRLKRKLMLHVHNIRVRET